MEITWPIAGIISGVLIAILGWVWRLSSRLTKMEVRTDLFWDMVRKNMTDLVRSPIHTHKDYLISKLKDKTLSQQEAIDLHAILDAEMFEEHDKGAKLGLALVNTLVTQYLIERKKSWIHRLLRS